jgi:anti-sigma factor ChrR (cupin superfamily)
VSELNENAIVLRNLMTANGRCSLRWEPFREGVEIHRLYDRGENGPSAALLRYRPGARVPMHAHTGYEHIFIISGSQVDRCGSHTAGTLIVNPPGSQHDVHSPEGCTVLAIWERPVIFLGNEK